MMAVDDEGMAVPISAIGGSRIGQMRMARLERVMHMVEFVGIGRGPEDRRGRYGGGRQKPGWFEDRKARLNSAMRKIMPITTSRMIMPRTACRASLTQEERRSRSPPK